jgi:D-serine deaminase-like pyridoxal phosphate-dependent protein
VVRAVRAAPGLRLSGVAGYEGSYGHSRSGADVDGVRRFLRELVSLAGAVDAPTVTAGGSSYPDLVAEEFTALGPGVRKVLRSGAYVTHDHGHYAELAPFPLEPALRVWAVVISIPEPGLALLNLGKRDASFDLALPLPLTVLRVGDWVECGISHPCTMFDRWAALPLVDADGRVTDLIRTFF